MSAVGAPPGAPEQLGEPGTELVGVRREHAEVVEEVLAELQVLELVGAHHEEQRTEGLVAGAEVPAQGEGGSGRARARPRPPTSRPRARRVRRARACRWPSMCSRHARGRARPRTATDRGRQQWLHRDSR